VGYTGGSTANPTYKNLGDHTESIQMDFDPAQVTYGELLSMFWDSHNPESPATCQYKSAIYYHDETQQQLAEQTKQQREADYGVPLLTDILAVEMFYRAEDYHQKYYLRSKFLLKRDLTTYYPDPDDFTDSTASARVNGVAGWHYTAERLEAEIGSFGLSTEANDVLRSLVAD
jgi:peptide-methionine (S)-S-oxide reductase